MTREPASAKPPSAAPIEVRRHLPALPVEVFDAWVDPTALADWMTPIGRATAELDLRVGGRFRIVMVGAGREIVHTGEYLEIDPPHRLAFTWRSPYTGERPSRVTVRLDAAGDGTDLTLVHEDLPAEAADSHRGGWGAMLDRLADRLAPPA